MNNNQLSRKTYFLLTIWLLSIVLGFFYLTYYSNNEGEFLSQDMKIWPAQSLIKTSLEVPTLIMFLHPKCPCSKASLYELMKLTPKLSKKIETILIFSIPPGFDKSWAEDKNLELAKMIKNATIIYDYNYFEADIFNIKTSGHTLVFSEDKKIIFSGGLTPSRGHQGETPGQEFIIDYFGNNIPNNEIYIANVYGCSIK